MPPQWKDGQKPKGIKEEMILVLGPDDYDDEAHVRYILDEYTIRMEAVAVVMTSDEQGKGVSAYARRWSEKNWWPRYFNNPGWWGWNPKAGRNGRKRNARALESHYGHIIGQLLLHGKPHAHCIAFWNEDQDDYLDLMEQARETVPLQNFQLIRVI